MLAILPTKLEMYLLTPKLFSIPPLPEETPKFSYIYPMDTYTKWTYIYISVCI